MLEYILRYTVPLIRPIAHITEVGQSHFAGEEATSGEVAHRVEEGASLTKDLLKRISNIKEQEECILKLEPARMIRINK